MVPLNGGSDSNGGAIHYAELSFPPGHPQFNPTPSQLQQLQQQHQQQQHQLHLQPSPLHPSMQHHLMQQQIQQQQQLGSPGGHQLMQLSGGGTKQHQQHQQLSGGNNSGNNVEYAKIEFSKTQRVNLIGGSPKFESTV